MDSSDLYRRCDDARLKKDHTIAYVMAYKDLGEWVASHVGEIGQALADQQNKRGERAAAVAEARRATLAEVIALAEKQRARYEREGKMAASEHDYMDMKDAQAQMLALEEFAGELRKLAEG